PHPLMLLAVIQFFWCHICSLAPIHSPCRAYSEQQLSGHRTVDRIACFSPIGTVQCTQLAFVPSGGFIRSTQALGSIIGFNYWDGRPCVILIPPAPLPKFSVAHAPSCSLPWFRPGRPDPRGTA